MRTWPIKHMLIAFLTGLLMTTGVLSVLGYSKWQEFNKEKESLQALLKKKDWRLDNLKTNQSRLTDELDRFKQAKEKSYNSTISALIQAKENAGLEALYEIGIKALNAKDYPRAYFALSQVNKVNSEYKALKTEFPIAEKAYNNYQQQVFDEKLKATYAQAFDHQAKGQYAQAKASYENVVQMKSDFKDAKLRLLNVTKYLDTHTRTRALQQKNAWLNSTYKLGLAHQASGRYALAKDAYYKILKDTPIYKDTSKRMKFVTAKLPAPTPPPVQAIAPDCYAKGLAIGQCARSPDNPACAQLQTSAPPVECKNNPEFMRGYKSTMQNVPDPNTERDPSGLLKGLSSVLKNL